MSLIISPEQAHFYFKWGQNLIDQMNFPEMKFFLIIAGAIFRSEPINLAKTNMRILTKWGFTTLLLAPFDKIDWKLFLALLEQLSEGDLIEIASEIQ